MGEATKAVTDNKKRKRVLEGEIKTGKGLLKNLRQSRKDMIK